MSSNTTFDRDRFREYQRTRDPRLRSELVEEHVGLAYSIARRFEHRGETRDDLRQVALVALMAAVDRFDVDRAVRFTTFATPTIAGALKRHLRDHTWFVRPPRSVTERGLAASALHETLTNSLKHIPTIDELAAAGGWRREQVEEAMGAVAGRRHHGRKRLDIPTVDRSPATDDTDRVDDRVILERLLEPLRARERRIVEMRYFDELKHAEIAERIGISQMHVLRLLQRSLTEMRQAARERPLRAAS